MICSFQSWEVKINNSKTNKSNLVVEETKLEDTKPVFKTSEAGCPPIHYLGSDKIHNNVFFVDNFGNNLVIGNPKMTLPTKYYVYIWPNYNISPT